MEYLPLSPIKAPARAIPRVHAAIFLVGRVTHAYPFSALGFSGGFTLSTSAFTSLITNSRPIRNIPLPFLEP
jgi:hypothetical protein